MKEMSARLVALVASALIFAAPAFAGTGETSSLGPNATMGEARNSVKGAETDLADARSYLAELEKGNFAGIYGVADDGSLRCGETEANPACAPLTAEDKAQALAEAREMIVNAEAELRDAERRFAGGKDIGVQEASYTN
jgi:hypothetical protein